MQNVSAIISFVYFLFTHNLFIYNFINVIIDNSNINVLEKFLNEVYENDDNLLHKFFNNIVSNDELINILKKKCV